MADLFTDDEPALPNQVAADVVSIEKTLGFLKDCFEQICTGWSNSSAASLYPDTSNYFGGGDSVAQAKKMFIL